MRLVCFRLARREVFQEANDSEKQFDALVTLAKVLLHLDEIEQAERVIFQLDSLLEKLDLEELAIDRLKSDVAVL